MALIAALTLIGCYAYHPISASTASAGTVVRVDLSDAGSLSVAPAIGPYATVIEGVIRDVNPTGLTIGLRRVSRRFLDESIWNGETIVLTRADIRDLNERVLSRGRTATVASVFSAGGIAILYAVIYASAHVSGTSGRLPPPPP